MKKNGIKALMLMSVLFLGILPVRAEETSEQVMYRLYNPNSGEHFYTADKEERNNLYDLGWVYEGVGWIAPVASEYPVYRLYNANGGEHHYTLDPDERDMLVDAGWLDEGIGWYSDGSEAVPLYREYNPNAFACNHNYTTSVSENDELVNLGWKYEGISWYAMREKTETDTEQDDLEPGSKVFRYPSLQSLGIDYDHSVDEVVDGELLSMQSWCNAQGVNILSVSDYDKACWILQYVGRNFSYINEAAYGDVVSMIAHRGDTCFGFSDLVYCLSRKVGLVNASLTVPGKNVSHNGIPYYGLHRTVVAQIDGRYYDMDGNLALYFDPASPEEITQSYAEYLLGLRDDYTSIRP